MKLISKADGFEFETYHAEPRDARRGGLVLIPEIYGVTPGIQRMADGFAESGYEVLVPHVFDRCEPGFSVERTLETTNTGFGYVQKVGFDRTLGDVQACIDALKGPVFMTGFCYGGTITWMAASRCGGLTAAVAYYGGSIAQMLDDKPKIPILLHFGLHDEYIPAENRAAIAAAYPDIPLYVYDTGHGFYSDDRPDYKPEPAQLSKLRTLQFFHQAASGKGEV